MDRASPARLVKDLDNQVQRILRPVDINKLDEKPRRYLQDLKQNMIDMRIYASAYELSETRQEQIANRQLAQRWLRAARQNILTASQFNIFNAVDVAHLSAQIDQASSLLK